MKSLFKLAMGAAIAGAVLNMLRKHRGGSHAFGHDDESRTGDASVEPMPTELVADSSSVGEGRGDDRVQLPDDGRVQQAPPNS